jgi:hypothetical protein
VLSPRAEIGGGGAKMGQVEHKDCEDLRSGKLSRGNAAHNKICRWIECQKSTAVKTLMLSSDRDEILTFLGNFSDVIGRKAGQA